MNGAGGNSGKLGHPASHVVAVGIELVALQNRIEDPEIGCGIGATTSHITSSYFLQWIPTGGKKPDMATVCVSYQAAAGTLMDCASKSVTNVTDM